MCECLCVCMCVCVSVSVCVHFSQSKIWPVLLLSRKYVLFKESLSKICPVEKVSVEKMSRHLLTLIIGMISDN